jgi:precorrin-2 dehydrogenase/sirohydrochlorin ferrochelatase
VPYYPIMLDIKAKRCVVVGGGEVALRKAQALADCGARVQVISPRLCPGLEQMRRSSTIESTDREYRHGDLKGAVLVVAATDDREANRRIMQEAESLSVLSNVVDDPELSNFIVPASLRRGDLTIAISTDGKSPALARKIRTRLEHDFGEEYAALVSLVEQVRSELFVRGISVTGEVWQQALDLDALAGLLRQGRHDEARSRLLDILEKR